MSTSWDIYCLDCDAVADVSSNHDPIRQNELQPLIEHATAIAALAPLLLDANGWELLTYGSSPTRAPVEWLASHAGHRLRMRNEYGEIEGQCRKKVRCEHCGQVQYGCCKLDVGHSGVCEASR
jgi:hypothetical protein